MTDAPPDFAVLLDAVNGIESKMAHDLLQAEGIPSVVQGPDFDMAELGRAAHDMTRLASLVVPRSALERARAVLEAAGWFGDED